MVTLHTKHDYTINAGGSRFGFVETDYNGFDVEWSMTATH
jgi:hypothetical protein